MGSQKAGPVAIHNAVSRIRRRTRFIYEYQSIYVSFPRDILRLLRWGGYAVPHAKRGFEVLPTWSTCILTKKWLCQRYLGPLLPHHQYPPRSPASLPSVTTEVLSPEGTHAHPSTCSAVHLFTFLRNSPHYIQQLNSCSAIPGILLPATYL